MTTEGKMMDTKVLLPELLVIHLTERRHGQGFSSD